MLAQYLINDGIILEPAIQKKWHILESLTRHFCKNMPEEVCAKILETILSRELIVSTGLGGGVAIPHARTNLVKNTGVIFARFKKGIEWGSIDGSLVYFLFLIIGPIHSNDEYLYVLSKISKMLRRNQQRSRLLKAQSPAEVITIFEDIKDRDSIRSN